MPHTVGSQDRAREAFAGLALTSSDNAGDRGFSWQGAEGAHAGARRWVVGPRFWQSRAHEPLVLPWGSKPTA